MSAGTGGKGAGRSSGEGRSGSAGNDARRGQGSRRDGTPRPQRRSDSAGRASGRPAPEGRGKRPAGRRGEAASARAPGRSRAVPKPELPSTWPRLPRDVYRDLRGAASAAHLDDVSAAFSAAGDALAVGDLQQAVALLEWAKSVAPRSAVVREALGVALYQAGSYGDARAELQTYRRISGRDDQLHLLADCVRAEGRPDLVEGYIAELLDSDADAARKVEGVLVLAGARADGDDLEGALAALRRIDEQHLPAGEPFVRHQYLKGDLLARLGRATEAAEVFAGVAEVAPAYLDVAERAAGVVSEQPRARRVGGSSG